MLAAANYYCLAQVPQGAKAVANAMQQVSESRLGLLGGIWDILEVTVELSISSPLRWYGSGEEASASCCQFLLRGAGALRR